VPSTIKITVGVEGLLSVASEQRWYTEASVALSVWLDGTLAQTPTENNNYSGIAGGRGAVRAQSLEGIVQPLLHGDYWDPFSSLGPDPISLGASFSFTGALSTLSNYDPALRGYAYTFGMTSATRTFGGGASLNAEHTGWLKSLTYQDGTPLTGFQVSSESGMTFAPVPEPSSNLLAIMAMAAVSVETLRTSLRHKKELRRLQRTEVGCPEL
jgi:hypothetical protein